MDLTMLGSTPVASISRVVPELSEAINSMFRWYHRSAVCYAYLSDLEPSTQVEVGLHNCRWVRRGWTLQELIAPNSVELYNRDWDYIGSKSGERLAKLLSQITGIIIEILNHKARLSSISVAHRMAWAARRETTRIEDRAYSILGIFGVNMPMLYGEEEKAFRRLQEEIIKQAADLTIFAWNLPASTRPAHGEEMVCGILARSLDYFAECPLLESDSIGRGIELSVANNRVRTDATSFIIPFTGPRILCMVLHSSDTTRIGVKLMSFGANDFVRFDPWSLCSVDGLCHIFSNPSTKISILGDVTEADDLGNNACLMRPFLLDRRECFLHFQTAPGLELYTCSPGGRFDPADQIIYAPNLSSQDFTIAWPKLSIDTAPLAVNSVNPGPLSRTYLFVAMGWSRYRYLNIREAINKVQFTIIDATEHWDVLQGLVELIMGREDAVMNPHLVGWLNRHQVRRASCILNKSLLDNFGGQCLRVSVKPSVASDTELSRHKFLRFTFSWEIGDLAVLSRDVPTPMAFEPYSTYNI